jgi:hypothetical protein
MAMPTKNIQRPAGTLFNHSAAPLPNSSSATEPKMGYFDGSGTK